MSNDADLPPWAASTFPSLLESIGREGIVPFAWRLETDELWVGPGLAAV